MPRTSFNVRMLCGVLSLLSASTIVSFQPSTKQLTQIFLGSLGAYYAFEVLVWPQIYNALVEWNKKENDQPNNKSEKHSSFFLFGPQKNAIKDFRKNIYNAQEFRFKLPEKPEKNKLETGKEYIDIDDKFLNMCCEKPGELDKNIKTIKAEVSQSFSTTINNDYYMHLRAAHKNTPKPLFDQYKNFYHLVQDSFGKLGNKPAPTLTTQTETAQALYSLAALVQAFPTICHSVFGLAFFGRALPIELWAWEGGRHCLDVLVTLVTYVTTKEKLQELALPLAAGLGIGYGAQKILDEIDLQRFGKSILIVPRILPGIAFVNDVSGQFPATKELGSQVVSDNLVQDTVKVMTWLQIGKGMMKHIHYKK